MSDVVGGGVDALDRVVQRSVGPRGSRRGAAMIDPLATATEEEEPDTRKKKKSTTRTTTSCMEKANGAAYLPAATWQGPKAGYYFGTTKMHGTGYHLDPVVVDSKKRAAPEDEGTATTTMAKKPKRGVQIAEDRNETRLLLRSTPKTGDDLLKQAEQDAEGLRLVDLTVTGVYTAAGHLQKAATRNQLARAQHADTPANYMESEVTLYEHLQVCKALAAEPKLYPVFVEASGRNDADLCSTLLQLLGHENPDVAASVVSVLLEWLETYQVENDDKQDVPVDMGLIVPVIQLAGHLLREGGLLDLLVSNLGRLSSGNASNSEPGDHETNQNGSNDVDDEVGRGSLDVLTLLENLVEMDLTVELVAGQESPLRLVSKASSHTSVAAKLCQETRVVSWLLQQVEEGAASSSASSSLPFYGRCFEVLALLAPREEVHAILDDWSTLPVYKSVFDEEEDDDANPKPTKDETKHMDGIEILLQSISTYRKRQPETAEQVEQLENACLVLSAALQFSPTTNLQAFLEAQGIQLILRCLKERVHAGGSALLLLDFAGSSPIHRQACEQLVQAGGLKYLLPLFLGRNGPKPAATLGKKAKKAWIQSKVDAAVVRIMYALTRHLDDDTPHDAKARLLAKFAQDETKCDRLVEVLLHYDAKARAAEYKFFRYSSKVHDEDDEEEDDLDEATQVAALEAKLAGGGDLFHRAAAVAAFLGAGSRTCHARLEAQLRLHQSGLSLIRLGLQEFVSVLEPEQAAPLQAYLDDTDERDDDNK